MFISDASINLFNIIKIGPFYRIKLSQYVKQGHNITTTCYLYLYYYYFDVFNIICLFVLLIIHTHHQQHQHHHMRISIY